MSVRILSRLIAFVSTILILVTPIAAQQQPQRYVVQPGETLAIIAARYGTTWYDLAVANNILNPNLIYAGQVLVIPTSRPNPIPVYSTYTIVYGDTLSTIALRYGTTVEAIVAVNNISAGTRLYPGQVLNLPVSTQPYYPPTPVPVYGRYYTVRPGDTMFRIGQYFGVNIYDIAEANGILNLNRIYVGQVLRIP